MALSLKAEGDTVKAVLSPSRTKNAHASVGVAFSVMGDEVKALVSPEAVSLSRSYVFSFIFLFLRSHIS